MLTELRHVSKNYKEKRSSVTRRNISGVNELINRSASVGWLRMNGPHCPRKKGNIKRFAMHLDWNPQGKHHMLTTTDASKLALEEMNGTLRPHKERLFVSSNGTMWLNNL